MPRAVKGDFTAASATSSSMARRRMPRPTATSETPSREGSEIAASGSCRFGAVPRNSHVRASGTNTSATSTSWLPVPLRPFTRQVSSTRASLVGKNAPRSTGTPSGPNRGVSPSNTRPPATSQVLCVTPLAYWRRPRTR